MRAMFELGKAQEMELPREPAAAKGFSIRTHRLVLSQVRSAAGEDSSPRAATCAWLVPGKRIAGRVPYHEPGCSGCGG